MMKMATASPPKKNSPKWPNPKPVPLDAVVDAPVGLAGKAVEDVLVVMRVPQAATDLDAPTEINSVLSEPSFQTRRISLRWF